MAKFHGKIGYDTQVEKLKNGLRTGVWIAGIVEKDVCGDIVQNYRKTENLDDKVNADINISNRMSIVADPYAVQNIPRMRYLVWNDVAWNIKNIEINYPRLVLTIGGMYNGQRPSPTPSGATDNLT